MNQKRLRLEVTKKMKPPKLCLLCPKLLYLTILRKRKITLKRRWRLMNQAPSPSCQALVRIIAILWKRLQKWSQQLSQKREKPCCIRAKNVINLMDGAMS